jgi:hypothetical protein
MPETRTSLCHLCTATGPITGIPRMGALPVRIARADASEVRRTSDSDDDDARSAAVPMGCQGEAE